MAPSGIPLISMESQTIKSNLIRSLVKITPIKIAKIYFKTPHPIHFCYGVETAIQILGGRTERAIAGFLNDRDLQRDGTLDQEEVNLLSQLLNTCVTRPQIWSRHVKT
jgi:hypothetical protein